MRMTVKCVKLTCKVCKTTVFFFSLLDKQISCQSLSYLTNCESMSVSQSVNRPYHVLTAILRGRQRVKNL